MEGPDLCRAKFPGRLLPHPPNPHRATTVVPGHGRGRLANTRGQHEANCTFYGGIFERRGRMESCREDERKDEEEAGGGRRGADPV